MSNHDTIREFLQTYSNGKYRSSEIEYSPESNDYMIVIPNQVSITEHAKRMLKRRLFEKFEAAVTVLQAKVTRNFHLAEQISTILESIRANVEDVTVFVEGGQVEVVIFVDDCQEVESLDGDKKIRRKLNQFFKKQKLYLTRYFFSRLGVDPPSEVQILKVIGQLSPVTYASIKEAFDSGESPIPSDNWLRRMLDRLRRDGLVVWQRPGTYVLSSSGLAALPHLKGRRSLNIKRALELAKRRW